MMDTWANGAGFILLSNHLLRVTPPACFNSLLYCNSQRGGIFFKNCGSKSWNLESKAKGFSYNSQKINKEMMNLRSQIVYIPFEEPVLLFASAYHKEYLDPCEVLPEKAVI